MRHLLIGCLVAVLGFGCGASVRMAEQHSATKKAPQQVTDRGVPEERPTEDEPTQNKPPQQKLTQKKPNQEKPPAKKVIPRPKDKPYKPKPRTHGPNEGAKTQLLEGTVMREPRNCGGMRRPPQPARPVVGQRFLVRSGNWNINENTKPVAEFRSGAKGRFEVRLKLGVYCVVAQDKEVVRPRPKHRKTDKASWKAACMADWSRRCDAVWKVTWADPKDLILTASRPCFGPCYRGPYPP